MVFNSKYQDAKKHMFSICATISCTSYIILVFMRDNPQNVTKNGKQLFKNGPGFKEFFMVIFGARFLNAFVISKLRLKLAPRTLDIQGLTHGVSNLSKS